MEKTPADPLRDKKFRPPGLLECLGRDLFGFAPPLDCVQIEVTSVCSARCVYCPHTTMGAAWKSRHMAAETFAALWPCLRKAGRAHLQGWGEPLLHPRFFDFARFAQQAGCRVSSTSCGLFLHGENAEKLARSGMDMLAVSLVGTDAQSNDARAGADFERVCAGIRELRRAIKEAGSAMEIHLAYLLLADRLEAARRLPALMEDLDVDAAIVSTLDYLALPEQENLAYFPHEAEKIAAARTVLQKAAEEAAQSGRMLHYSLPSTQTGQYPGGCRENVARTLYVDADGQISPCVYLNVPGSADSGRIRVFGNARRTDPLQIWREAGFAAFRANLVAGIPDSACLDCPKRHEA